MRTKQALLLCLAFSACTFNRSGLPGTDASVGDVALEGLLFHDSPPPDQAHDIPVIPFREGGPISCGSLFVCSAKDNKICVGSSYVDREECRKGCGPTGTCVMFDASNEAASVLPLGAVDLVIPDKKSVQINTEDCTISSSDVTLPAGIITAAPGERCVVGLNKLTVAGTLTASGRRALLIAAHGTVSVAASGLIEVGGKGNAPGPGGGVGGKPGSKPPGGSADGEGAGCGGGNAGDEYWDGVAFKGIYGGSGASNGGVGGKGGNAGSKAGAAPNLPCDGVKVCSGILLTGSGGGAGGCTVAGGCPSGGGGGGGLQISSLQSIVIKGKINAGGGGGGAGDGRGTSGAGGGSGGGVLLEAFEVRVEGADGLVTANGGGGGSGSLSLPCWIADGNNGKDGSPSTVRTAGGEGVDQSVVVTHYRSGQGGQGSGAGKDGLAGGDASSICEHAGGGGGGAGRICVRIDASKIPAAEDGTFSPTYAKGSEWPVHIEAVTVP
jgi:hypothetical protein